MPSNKNITEFDLPPHKLVLRKFTPQVGGYWATKLQARVGTSFNNAKEGQAKIAQFMTASREDWEDLYNDCLANVFVKFPAGNEPILRAGEPTVDLDNAQVLVVMMQSFMFSMMDFFTVGETAESKAVTLNEIQSMNEYVNSSISPSPMDTGNNTSYGTEHTP